MDVKEALNQLVGFADDFVRVGDAKDAIANDREGFLHARTKVMQYYRYILSKTEALSDDWLDLIDIMNSIIERNPSLEEWVHGIMVPKSMQSPKPEAKDSTIDTSSLANKIDSFATEIRNMQFWDEDKVDDIASQLRQSVEELQKNRGSFDPGVYASLLADATAALDKIERFEKMTQSDTLADVRRM